MNVFSTLYRKVFQCKPADTDAANQASGHYAGSRPQEVFSTQLATLNSLVAKNEIALQQRQADPAIATRKNDDRQ
ncbi:hypothetical protein SynBIOSE41_02657 [Synechococcus sp. BIOS-E4-1]|nr:hypothetical protein SynBIOSE41_02657 [Synechococcus sp. BIOS-E4-1]